jgi:methyl-accepting chemotaxis protein WspA
MKHMTMGQRLNTTMALLLLLLLIGFLLFSWSRQARWDASQRNYELVQLRDHIETDILTLSDSIKGLLLNPKDPVETNRWRVTQSDLSATFDAVQAPRDRGGFAEHNELTNSIKALRDFTLKELGPFQVRIMELAEKDKAQSTELYETRFPKLRDHRENLLNDLNEKVDKVKEDERYNAHRKETAVGFLVAIICGLSVMVALMHSATVKKPLNRLVSSLERMRVGDFTERIELDRQDEFGVLGDGLNRLADDLSNLVGQVQRSGIQVNTTATQIAATAKEQQSTAHEIAATTAEIGATSKEISATSKELVKTMNEVNQVSEQTAQLAGSGQTSIGRMEATMRQIMDASGSITSKLAVLSEKTANINSVVTTITKVADQTNLLSLNAAIEAEKAGEYGLGFAVVAMEIRRLADQTAVATYDIEKMVKEMQSAVSAGVMGMDKFSEEVRRGVEEVRQVSTHLAQIIHQVQTLTPRFQTVNEGMHAQATGAQQISETLTQLTEAAQQTADSLRQSNQAIDQLNGAARSLQTSVARFKLSK